MRHTRKWMSTLLLLAIFSTLILSVPRVSAQRVISSNVSQECNSLDLVILIDESRSMEQFPANDVEGGRYEAAKAIIGHLGNQAVWLCSNENVKHRVAVVGFGDRSTFGSEDNSYLDDTVIYLDEVFPIEGEESDIFDSWRTQRKTLFDRLEADFESLIATDHESALLRGRDILQDWRMQPSPSDGDRRQAILIITDGEACTKSRGCLTSSERQDNPNAPNFDPVRYMEDLVELTDRNSDDFPFEGESNPNSVFISVLALTNSGTPIQQPYFRNNWEQITSEHGSRLLTANEDNSNIPSITSQLIGDIIDIADGRIQCGEPFVIEPYANDLIVLSAFLLDRTVDEDSVFLQVKEPDGNTVVIRRGVSDDPRVPIDDHIADGPNEIYTFRKPLPGIYSIQVDNIEECNGTVDITVDATSIEAEATLPSGLVFPAVPEDEDYPEIVKTYFEVVIEDSFDEPLVELPGYELDVTAFVENSVTGNTTSYKLTQQAPGVYRSDDFIQTPEEGEFEWRISAEVPSPITSTETISLAQYFASSSGTFSVEPVEGFGFRIDDSMAGTTRNLNTVQGTRQLPVSIPVSVFLTDADDNVIDTDEILTSTDGLFQASLVSDADDEPIGDPVTLTLKPGSDSEFVGELSNAHSNGQIVDAGNYTIVVDATWPEASYNTLKWRPFEVQESFSFSQREIVPLDFVVIPPAETVNIHRSFLDFSEGTLATLRRQPQPFEFQVEIFNAITSEPMPLEEVLRSPTASIPASLVPPSGNEKPVSLTPFSNARIQQLQGKGGQDINETGIYEIEVESEDMALQEQYRWATDEHSATLERADVWSTNPRIARMIAAAIATVLALILAYLIYIFSGGPRGYISVVESGLYGNTTELVPPLKLTPFRRVNKIKRASLQEYGIKSLTVRKTRPLDMDVKRAVYVQAKMEDGLDATYTIHDGMPEPFIEGEVLYESRQQS